MCFVMNKSGDGLRDWGPGLCCEQKISRSEGTRNPTHRKERNEWGTRLLRKETRTPRNSVKQTSFVAS